MSIIKVTPLKLQMPLFVIALMFYQQVMLGLGAVGNSASQRIIEKLGFQLLDRRPNILELPNNRFVDDQIYFKKDTSNDPDLDVTWE